MPPSLNFTSEKTTDSGYDSFVVLAAAGRRVAAGLRAGAGLALACDVAAGVELVLSLAGRVTRLRVVPPAPSVTDELAPEDLLAGDFAGVDRVRVVVFAGVVPGVSAA